MKRIYTYQEIQKTIPERFVVASVVHRNAVGFADRYNILEVLDTEESAVNLLPCYYDKGLKPLIISTHESDKSSPSVTASFFRTFFNLV